MRRRIYTLSEANIDDFLSSTTFILDIVNIGEIFDSCLNRFSFVILRFLKIDLGYVLKSVTFKAPIINEQKCGLLPTR